MKLKAIVVSAVTALALCGVFAGSAAASVVIWPSAQEMAEHPGEAHAVQCEMSEQESRDSQFTDRYAQQANAAGKCTDFWFKAESGSADGAEATARNSKAQKKQRKAKAHRHTQR